MVVLRDATTRFRIITSGTDQRLKMWGVSVDTAKDGVEGVQVEKLSNVFTPVADVSSMAVVRGEDDRVGVLVCGVGIDLWSIQ